jgi:hypothetical protein
MNIRHSTGQDLPAIMEIYRTARLFMAKRGNPNQWGPTNWPPEALIREDIRSKNSYVCVDDAGNIIGTFFFNQGKDIEPTYAIITNGQWMDNCSPDCHNRLPKRNRNLLLGLGIPPVRPSEN